MSPLLEQRHAGISAEPRPIWMAALLASGCRATANGAGRTIDWQCRSGRAVYTNGGAETVIIQPFGVPVRRGETVAVSWRPGDTAYTVELSERGAIAA